MKSLKLVSILGVCGVVFTPPLGAQEAKFGGPPRAVDDPVVNLAYSAQRVVTHTYLNARGGKQTDEETTTTARDSWGRTYNQHVYLSVNSASRSTPVFPTKITLIEIDDPVERYRYVVDSRNRVAHRVRLPGPGSPKHPNRSKPADGTPGWVSLGRQLIGGIWCEGERFTFQLPGSKSVSTTETWRDPVLKLMVRETLDDPISGVTVRELRNISRVEPNAELFKAPEGYTVVDETGPFKIDLMR